MERYGNIALYIFFAIKTYPLIETINYFNSKGGFKNE